HAGNPRAGSGRLVAVAWSISAFRCADFRDFFAKLALFVQGTVVRHHQMGGVAHQEIATNPDAKFSQALNFFHQRYRIDDNPVADHTNFTAPQNPRWNQMQNVFLAAMNDGVASVVATLTAHDDVGVGGKHVDDLSLSFVTPLRADQDRVGHDVLGKILSRCARSRQSGLASKDKSGGVQRKTILDTWRDN